MSKPDVCPVTRQSIAAAKAARDAERAEIARQTGVQITDDGKLALALGNAIWYAVNSTREEHR